MIKEFKHSFGIVKNFFLIMIICVIILSLSILITSVNAAVGSNAEGQSVEKKVLFISSYHPGFETFFDQVGGLKSVFDDKNQIDYTILLDIEYMDTKRFDDAIVIGNFKTSLGYKLGHLPAYDLIIVGDDRAYEFVIDERDTLFREIPIVFLGLNGLDMAKKAKEYNDVTGIVEAISIEENIKLALGMSKGQQVTFIVDNTISGQKDLNYVKELLPKIQDDLSGKKIDFEYQVINFSTVSLGTFKEQLMQMQQNNPIILLSSYVSGDGITYSFTEGLKIITDTTKAPIFHPYMHGIGQGIVGGKVINHFNQGAQAAKLALDVFDETKQFPDIIFESPNQYLMDKQVFDKFQYSVSDLQDMTEGEPIIWINDDSTEMNKLLKTLLPILFFVMIEGLFLYFLIRAIKVNQFAENKLLRQHHELEGNHALLFEKEQEIYKQYTELLEYKTRLEESRSRYVLAFKASGGGIWDEDFVTGAVYIKGDWYRQYVDDAVGITQLSEWHELICDEDKPEYDKKKSIALNSHANRFELEYRIYSKKLKKIVWINETGYMLRDANEKITRIVGGHQDITTKKEQEEKILQLVHIDILTGLINKATINEKVKELCENTYYSNSLHAVILIDIDDFKHVNETFGHEIGDQILKQVGKRFAEIIDYQVTIGRFGGDEFVAIIENYSDLISLESIINKIRKVFIKEFVYKVNKFTLTSSLGVAIYPQDGLTADQLLRNADLAMYQSKEKGKNIYAFFNEDMFLQLEEKLGFSKELYLGILNDELYLDYQPIYTSKDSEIYGFEALLRWNSKKYGQVSPVRIIKEAESSGLIHELGLWVFREAVKTIKALNIYYDSQLKMSVNLSAVQFKRKDMLQRYLEFINQFEVNFSNIVLEITETALIQNFAGSKEILESFKQKGIKIALDDFGTGYSSLGYFKQLPVDYIKIDKSFINDIGLYNYDQLIVEIIKRLAHSRNLLVVAEGVETIEQLNVIKAMDIDLLQGYYFSKPINEENLFKLMDVQYLKRNR